MTDPLATRAHITPHKPALIFERETITYGALQEMVALWAGRLEAMGVSRGNVVALLLSNSPTYAILLHATLRLGATLLPLNLHLTTGELRQQLEHAGATIMLSTEDLLEPHRDLNTLLPCHDVLSPDVPSGEPVFAGEMHLENRAIILFTSGTTGTPKAVSLSFGNFYFSANASAYRLGLDPHDLWLCPMSLYHVGGLSILLRSCLYGTAALLQGRFDVGAVAAALADPRVTLASLVPTMLFRLLQDPSFKSSSALRHILLGGAATNAEVLGAAKARDLPIAPTYGLTEATSQVATATAAKAFAKPGTVGKPLLFTELRIADESGVDLPAGEIGKLLIRGPTVTGYLKDDAATARAFQTGWFYTGDLGYLDADGDLFVVQRRSDLIVTGGENVYPAEVEAVLRAYPAVAEACVVGLENAEWGQEVVAALVLVDKQTYGPRLFAALDAACRSSLARYKRPRRYVLMDDFPTTSSGKVQRHLVKEKLLG